MRTRPGARGLPALTVILLPVEAPPALARSAEPLVRVHRGERPPAPASTRRAAARGAGWERRTHPMMSWWHRLSRRCHRSTSGRRLEAACRPTSMPRGGVHGAGRLPCGPALRCADWLPVAVPTSSWRAASRASGAHRPRRPGETFIRETSAEHRRERDTASIRREDLQGPPSATAGARAGPAPWTLAVRCGKGPHGQRRCWLKDGGPLLVGQRRPAATLHGRCGQYTGSHSWWNGGHRRLQEARLRPGAAGTGVRRRLRSSWRGAGTGGVRTLS